METPKKITEKLKKGPKPMYFSEQSEGVLNSSLSSISRKGKEPRALIHKNMVCVSDSRAFIKNIKIESSPDEIFLIAQSSSKKNTNSIMLTVNPESQLLTITTLKDGRYLHVSGDQVEYILPNKDDFPDNLIESEIPAKNGDILVLGSNQLFNQICEEKLLDLLDAYRDENGKIENLKSASDYISGYI